MRRVALRNNVASTSLASTALCRNAQFKLDVVKTHPGPDMARNVTVRDSMANADDHGWAAGSWLLVNVSSV
jgi:hypothetical protein